MAKTKEVLHQEGNATGGISSAITIAKEKGQMKYLDPKVDLIFKKIFSKHPDLLMSLLNALLPLNDDEQIQSIKYLPTELVPELYEHKNSIVDVLCEDIKGRKFCVEMQMEWSNAFQQRVLFNASKLYVSQAPRAQNTKTSNQCIPSTSSMPSSSVTCPAPSSTTTRSYTTRTARR